MRKGQRFETFFCLTLGTWHYDYIGWGRGEGKGGGGGVWRDPDYIIFLNHTFLPQFQTKPLLLKSTSVKSCERNCFVSDDFKGDIFFSSLYLYILSVYVLLLF